MPEADALLAVADLHAWYGESHVLHGMNFEVREGEVVTLLGRNGAGKTTTLRAILGIVRQRRGSVRLGGQETISLGSDRIARLGVGYCPEERGIFASLSVEENLLLPPVVRAGGMSVPEIYTLFPNLEERRKSQGTKLSGGEQQMLAIGRILRTGARLLLLDEPTEGLAPVIVQQIGSVIRGLKDKGFTILLVESELPVCRNSGPTPLCRGGRPRGRSHRQRQCGSRNRQTPRLSGGLSKGGRDEAQDGHDGGAHRRVRRARIRRGIGAVLRQRRQDRRHDRHVVALFRPRRQGVGRGRRDGGEGFRRQGRRRADRDHLGRSPEQAGHRLGPRAANGSTRRASTCSPT